MDAINSSVFRIQPTERSGSGPAKTGEPSGGASKGSDSVVVNISTEAREASSFTMSGSLEALRSVVSEVNNDTDVRMVQVPESQRAPSVGMGGSLDSHKARAGEDLDGAEAEQGRVNSFEATSAAADSQSAQLARLVE